MLNALQSFYFNRPAEEQELMLFLRGFILDFSEHFSEHFKFNTAFFYFKGKMFCYFGQEKKSRQIYVGFVMGKHLKHPALEAGGRKQIKVLTVKTNEDIPLPLLNNIFKEAVNLQLSVSPP